MTHRPRIMIIDDDPGMRFKERKRWSELDIAPLLRDIILPDMH